MVVFVEVVAEGLLLSKSAGLLVKKLHKFSYVGCWIFTILGTGVVSSTRRHVSEYKKERFIHWSIIA